ncbi:MULTISPECIES: aldo/keto reductase [unclassified Rathayibacter]|uniref:aldo/keto reductase n=1 Tax=unclassified Rathayibacter TaxID=2609250 RepID=UPI00188B8846|nr:MULTISPECIES: aldo/keto reductase [unclassified Rathayibacter]MBF4463378.1 aldo/keto reductase [Rathayibacter sp. VKM Ac-2879]MBF4504899.1 aldo/keto reductase [Rathayibacter sp. VKM Ac-2878]
MDSTRLGTSGLQVSAIILGCMSFGAPDRGAHGWTMGEEESRPFLRRALELGITTFDTADIYSDGTSEEFVGRALADFAVREDVVIATKVHGRMRPGPNGGGLSRRHILSAIDDSLRRLGTDYVDLYQIHRWDPETPIEETMETLHDVVRSGKARYIGASSMWAWQFAKAQYTADLGGWTRFVSMQDQYNLIQREDERELHPFCLDQGVGVIPWSPLARGRLTRDAETTTPRTETDAFGATLYHQQEESDRRTIAAVAHVAEQRGVPRAQVALAWVRQHEVVTAPIVGATTLHHLDDAVASLALELTAEELETLGADYAPRFNEGF